MNKLHDRLWGVVIRSPNDHGSWDWAPNQPHTPQCSWGCKYFNVLEEMPCDWGVCSNKLSHRAGLLTFEHQGCNHIKLEDE